MRTKEKLAKSPSKFLVSKIKRIWLRRLIIVLTFPFMAAYNVVLRHIIMVVWNSPFELIELINASTKVWSDRNEK